MIRTAMITRLLRFKASAMLSSKLVKGATLKIYPGGSHGLATTAKDQLNADLLEFIKS
jgi:non-heme chloroperoxidase